MSAGAFQGLRPLASEGGGIRGSFSPLDGVAMTAPGQLTLLSARHAPRVPGIDLRCCDVAQVLASVHPGSVSLVVADPPWDLYQREPGKADPSLQYSLLNESQIGEHLATAAGLLTAGGRLALWTCWPLLVDALSAVERPPWLDVPGLSWRTGGAWTKHGPPGVGYHWRGKSEPVLLGCVEGASGRPAALVRSGYASDPEEHSRKPAEWMADWIRAWVPPGGLVLDLYAGLGSVPEAIVLAGEGRRYLGAEIDSERHAAALTRIWRAYRRTP